MIHGDEDKGLNGINKPYVRKDFYEQTRYEWHKIYKVSLKNGVRQVTYIVRTTWKKTRFWQLPKATWSPEIGS